MRLALVLALTLLLQPPIPKSAEKLRWVPNPREANGGWVSDPSGRLRAETVDSINGMLDAFERETTSEIAVAVVDSLSGLEPGDAALALHRLWGVGKRDLDNGILFLWAPNDRAIFISVGYGLEGVLPDARAGRVRDEEIFPRLREEKFDEGVTAGVAALMAAAREETEFRPGAALAARERSRQKARNILLAVFGGLGTGVAGVAGFFARRRYLRNKPRLCPNGHGPMSRLTEHADDKALDRGEVLEERLRSVDYDVWACGRCEAQVKVPYRRAFSVYTNCPKCRRRTVLSKSKTLRAATTSSTGLRRVTQTCENCRWVQTREETIPRVSTSSSSSGGGSGGGGGGSSFGGGSAGGGGAGGRY